ncbi:MAG TPA: Orn/Lys/Arg decarboxylase N-terminal domain-containing protein [Victivallales bacterium]|nr:Orn/Lys/Arg decarboxylase N-terminal domain-containing protein [Victivallales bacterium]
MNYSYRRNLKYLYAIILFFICCFYFNSFASVMSTRPNPFPDICSLRNKDFPIMFVSDPKKDDQLEKNCLTMIKKALTNFGYSYFIVTKLKDSIRFFNSRKDISAIVIDMSIFTDKEDVDKGLESLKYIHDRNPAIPIFLITDEENINIIPDEAFSLINGYLWSADDTPVFNAGVIKRAADTYLDQILPPMFKALVKYVNNQTYSWAVPGHSGGSALLKSPAGYAFFKFFGENIFRADINTNSGTVGDALMHTGAVGEAEEKAAEIFGANYTYYVLNGTSTTNRIIFSGVVSKDDIVILDRNCHKSIIQGTILTDSRPIYLMPTRNNYGLICPINLNEFTPEFIKNKINSSHYLKDVSNKKPALAVITTPTYDGLIYNVKSLKKELASQVSNILFDEAWYAYGKFYPLYKNRYAMESYKDMKDVPPVFAGHSVHKLLSAFSQGGMLHVKNGSKDKISKERFDQAFLMHASTSPFTPLIASIDICSKMMEKPSGYYLIKQIIEESIAFRKKLAVLYQTEKDKKSWFFKPWQPEKIDGKPFYEVDDETLINSTKIWTLDPKNNWHGFDKYPAGYAMLDPLKVSILSPGLNFDGTMDETGIPMTVVEAYLKQNGVLSEKVGFYADLILFSPGITRGKSGTMLAKLMEFKNAYDSNKPLSEVLPELTKKYPNVYKNLTVKDLCHNMHSFFKKNKLPTIMNTLFNVAPELALLPSEAYSKLIKGETEFVPVSELKGRIVATMVVPYPPGIPILMPGERITEKTQSIVDFLKMIEDLDNSFPSFSLHVHGIKTEVVDGKNVYKIDCVKESNSKK